MSNPNQRDNYRANNPPCKSIHVRNMPPDAGDADVLALCRPFGRVMRLKVLPMPVAPREAAKAQAFVEFEDMRAAMRMVAFYVSDTEGPRVAGKSVFLQYSNRGDVGGPVLPEAVGGALAPEQPEGAAATAAGPVLVVGLDTTDPALGPTPEHICALFAPFGAVTQVALAPAPNGAMQAAVQMAGARAADEACARLNGTRLPRYMAVRHALPITVRVAQSAFIDVTSWEQQQQQRQQHTHTYGSGSAAQASGAAAADDGAGHRVLMAMIDDVAYAPSIDALAQVFAVYGPLARMTLSCRAGLWRALVEYADARAAATARAYLDGHAMYPEGANRLQVEFSTQPALVVPVDDEWGRDWTRPSGGAATTTTAAATAAAIGAAAASAGPTAATTTAAASAAAAAAANKGGASNTSAAAIKTGPFSTLPAAATAAAAAAAVDRAAAAGSTATMFGRAPGLLASAVIAAHEQVAKAAAVPAPNG